MSSCNAVPPHARPAAPERVAPCAPSIAPSIAAGTRPRVTKAVLPVAGLGTRFLPATKSIPKEMLPLVDRPLIQYAVDEAREAGIDEFVFVTARGKSALEDYFEPAASIERALAEKGRTDLLETLDRTVMPSGGAAFVRQQEPLGLGHAVWCARRLIGDEPFAVILPDDVIAAETSCLAQMVEAHRDAGGDAAVVAVEDIPRRAIGGYGVIDPGETRDRMVAMRGIVEKPAPEAAPSTLAVIGRYILPPSVFGALGRMRRGAGGEIQLTDAIADEIVAGRKAFGYRFAGRRFDCGSKAGFLRATVAFALERDDLGVEFADFIAAVATRRRAA